MTATSPLSGALRAFIDDPRWIDAFGLPPVARQLASDEPCEAAAAAFLTTLSRQDGEDGGAAAAVLDRDDAVARFLKGSLDAVALEAREHAAALVEAERALAGVEATPEVVAEALWGVFCPQAAGIRGREQERIDELRARRTVRVDEPAPEPIAEPSREVLLTSNVLLTVPLGAASRDLPDGVRAAVAEAEKEAQIHWYDHPIPIGVAPEANEVLYGLRALDDALVVERERGNLAVGQALPVALSVSVTHRALRAAASDYLAHEIRRAGGFRFVQPYVFTEHECQRIVAEVLAPVAERHLGVPGAETTLGVLGVDGPYGRHYSFLKALAPLWQVLHPEVRATFKIDLDQVFPQAELIAQTGRSALEHLANPLWGARGAGAGGGPLELGLLAGALVNEADIGSGLFTPDVPMPRGLPVADELVFYSKLPQAISTEAEMMTRYEPAGIDGLARCLERVHVTGGTTGARVDTLARHRLFTPSFIGRAEDQAYLLSALDGRPVRPAYLHAAGLIMRHDKAGFAGEAIAAAAVGKLVGDYVRIILFSEYANLIGHDDAAELIDPFTGAFASRMPTTVTTLRLTLAVLRAFADGEPDRARELATLAATRLADAHRFVADGSFSRTLEEERAAWNLYYDTIDALRTGLAAGDTTAEAALERLRAIVESYRITS